MKIRAIMILLGFWCYTCLPTVGLAQASIQLSGTLTQCPDTLLFFALDGVSLRPLAAIPLQQSDAGGSFALNAQELEEGMYFLGQGGPQNTRPILLGTEPEVRISGSCPQLRDAKLVSTANEDLQSVREATKALSQTFQDQIRRYRQALRTKQGIFEIEQEMKTTDQKKQALYDSLSIRAPFLAQWVGLNTYLSFQNHGRGHQNESVYFAEEYFRFTQLDDPNLNRMPEFHEAVKTYARNLASLSFDHQGQIRYGAILLDQIPAMSSAYKAATLGLALGFQGRTDAAFVHFAEHYLEEFPNDNPKIQQQLTAQIDLAKAKMIGAIAPEISLPSPTGDTLNLSDYRGKVVLIDFWASWCGPCRRENPQVVRMYEQYHDQGFEIFGVSLDKTKQSWEAAIAKDGLDWPQVSDLKGWRSRAAQLYGVSSIPYTILLDQEGRIVAKKLRGEPLAETIGRLLEKGTPNPPENSGK
jgi:peroxiredoxin